MHLRHLGSRKPCEEDKLQPSLAAPAFGGGKPGEMAGHRPVTGAMWQIAGCANSNTPISGHCGTAQPLSGAFSWSGLALVRTEGRQC